MRIQPAKSIMNNNKITKAQTQFESKNNPQCCNQVHRYTGIASVDLAWASMFDSQIARDLKLMGLI